MKKTGLKIYNKGNKVAEVLVYDVIGESWLGGISADAFAREIKSLGNLDTIYVRINSEGGNVFDGVAIYNTLVSNQAEIIVDIDGLAASIASIIAMAGNKVRIAQNAMFMIHDPWVIAAGSANELRQQADLLDKVRETLLNTYVKRSTADREVVSGLMTAESWMTAQEALEYGFVDEVTEALKVAACADVIKFRHKPEVLNKKEFKAVASDSLKIMRAKCNSRGLKRAASGR